jgi:hypothetical protein
MAEIHVLPTPKYAHEKIIKMKFEKVTVEFSDETNDKAALNEIERYFGKNFTLDKGGNPVVISAYLIGNVVNLDVEVPTVIKDSVLSSDEGYFLTSSDRYVKIFAKTKTGIFYAVTTFLQLVTKEKTGYIMPEITIADYPLLKMRGISDDISRGQISTLDNFKKIIRFLAMNKMNIYMPYIEDEFDFKSYPDFSEGRAPLDAEEVAELDEYAYLYHVEIIPIFETLGHMEDVLQKPEFEKYAEFPGAACVDVSNDSTYVFMKTLLSEIAPAFSSKCFNMAADESSDVGLSASKHLVDSLGIDVVHAQYYKKIYDILKSLGKEVMMYGDIILKNPQILSEIPKDITIVDWHYEAAFDYPSVQKFKDAGFKFIVSPAIWNFTGPFPNFYNSYANIHYFTQEGYKAGAVGVIVSTWNDNGAAELRELNYPGYAWSAECAWNPDNLFLHSESSISAEFENIFFHQYFQTSSDLPRIIYELLSSTSNQISWYEFWRAPFIVEDDVRGNVPSSNIPARVASIESSMPEVLSLIEQARHIVGANEDILDIYVLVADINKYWADKIIGVLNMRSVCADSFMSANDKNEKTKSIETTLLGSLAKLKDDYVKLYLRTNRHPMLQLIDVRFDDQKKSLKAGTGQLLASNYTFDQLLHSNFVYYPGSRPNNHSSSKVDSATFFKTISLAKLPESSMLQLIGDTYCKLFINGEFVGEVKARRTLTWNVEKERVCVFDITKFLHEGKNTFAVQAANYDNNGSAGCNIFAQIGNDTLVTDTSWKAAKGIISSDEISSADLKNAAVYDNGLIIAAPVFSMGLKSWIER